jgi:uncharacterized protein GlcG (DUF336 family)
MNSAAQPARSFATSAITHAAAVALVAAARAVAEELGTGVAVAVTDAGGHLTAFERQDGVPFLTAKVAIDKAWTAASFGVATHDWNRYITDPKIAPLANVPRLMPVGGGNPIKDGGKLVGGIGVSGGNAQQDQDIAEAALKSLGFDAPG